MAANLPQFQNNDRDFQLLQSKWASILNPFVNNPTNNSIILTNVTLTPGTNVINHKLDRKLQGWKLVRQRAYSAIYDVQDTNPSQDVTLWLVSSHTVVVDIEVF